MKQPSAELEYNIWEPGNYKLSRHVKHKPVSKGSTNKKSYVLKEIFHYSSLHIESYSRVFSASFMTQINFLQSLERVDWIWLKSLHIPSKNGVNSSYKNNTNWNL